MVHGGRRTPALLGAVCVLPMLVAALVLQGGGQREVRGVIDDVASCRAAGAMYVAATDECAFSADVSVPPGTTLELTAALTSYSFHRGLDVQGTLVAGGAVTTTEDVVVARAGRVVGRERVRPVAAVRADPAG